MIAASGSVDAWFEPQVIGRDGAPRLFCLPYAGGSASTYRPWISQPWSGVSVCPVLLPGRERRIAEPPFRRLGALAEALAEVLPTDRPFALFGHSMGALVAYELARALRRSAKPPPIHLFVSGAPAPDLVPNRPARCRLERAALVAELAALGGTPPEVLANDELLDLFLPTVRADFAMLDTYRWEVSSPLDVPVTVFYGSEDAEVDESEVFGWRQHTVADASFVRIRGDHFFVESDGDLVRERIARNLAVPA